MKIIRFLKKLISATGLALGVVLVMAGLIFLLSLARHANTQHTHSGVVQRQDAVP